MPPPGANSRQPRAASLPSDTRLANLFAPHFQILLHQRHELVGYGTVDEAVIVAEREVNDGADGDGIVAFFVGNHERLLGNAAYAHDRRVRLVDDGQTEDGAELAGVGNSESRTLDVFGLELLVAGAFAEIGDAALQAEEVEVSGIFEDGNDESPVEGNGDSNVDVSGI